HVRGGKRHAVSGAALFGAARGRPGEEIARPPRSMLQLQGAPALSSFRIAKLLRRLRAIEPAVSGLSAQFVHFVDLERELDARERQILGRLLTYGPRLETGGSGSGALLLVVPRAGTISPWSSKATDIAHVCELHAVRR